MPQRARTLDSQNPGRTLDWQTPGRSATHTCEPRLGQGVSAVHVLLVWDGREFRTSTRLAPFDVQPSAE